MIPPDLAALRRPSPLDLHTIYKPIIDALDKMPLHSCHVFDSVPSHERLWKWGKRLKKTFSCHTLDDGRVLVVRLS